MPKRAGLSREVMAAGAAHLMDAAGGPDALTLTEVAEHFNVKVPSLYNHVNGVDDLRDAVARYTLEQFYEVLRDAAVGRSAGDALMAIAHAGRRFASEHPGLYPLLMRPVKESDRDLGQRIIDVFLIILRAYNLSDEDAIHAIRGVRSIMHGFVDIERAGGFGIPLDLDESYRRLVATFIQGLDGRSSQ